MNQDTDAALGSESNPLRVAIVGSGPSGFYAAEALFKSAHCVRVDMIERLPVPFGLVRYGVAPDHPKLKQITLVFEKIAQDPRFSFLGNVALGRDLRLEQLQETHHVIILAYGAESDRRMGVPNEDLPGSHTATAFVGWYNGHPQYRDHRFDLSGETAVVIGQGNVAIDVVRMLAKPIDELRKTDIAAHALEALAASRVRDIHVIGRRGPAQSSFTTKELRELGDIADCNIRVSTADLELGMTCLQELADNTNTNAAANVELFRKWAGLSQHSAAKSIHFHFLKSPTALRGSGVVQQIVLERNRLCGAAFAQQAVGTAQHSELSCDIVFRSIGYRGVPIPGLPFNDSLGIVPHRAGRVGDLPGLYAVGWIKRGPSGIIGTNRADALDTVQTVLRDLASIHPHPKPGAAGLDSALAQTRARVTTYRDWLKIDAEERRLGAALNKPREKITRINHMLDIAAAPS